LGVLAQCRTTAKDRNALTGILYTIVYFALYFLIGIPYGTGMESIYRHDGKTRSGFGAFLAPDSPPGDYKVSCFPGPGFKLPENGSRENGKLIVRPPQNCAPVPHKTVFPGADREINRPPATGFGATAAFCVGLFLLCLLGPLFDFVFHHGAWILGGVIGVWIICRRWCWTEVVMSIIWIGWAVTSFAIPVFVFKAPPFLGFILATSVLWVWWQDISERKQRRIIREELDRKNQKR